MQDIHDEFDDHQEHGQDRDDEVVIGDTFGDD